MPSQVEGISVLGEGTEPLHGTAQGLSGMLFHQKCPVSSKLGLPYTQTGHVTPQLWSAGPCLALGAELGRGQQMGKGSLSGLPQKNFSPMLWVRQRLLPHRPT